MFDLPLDDVFDGMLGERPMEDYLEGIVGFCAPDDFDYVDELNEVETPLAEDRWVPASATDDEDRPEVVSPVEDDPIVSWGVFRNEAG